MTQVAHIFVIFVISKSLQSKNEQSNEERKKQIVTYGKR